MDADIQFGDIAEQPPAAQPSPAQNPLFACVPCGSSGEHELPIFVALDALLDMEAHALENPEVELGGVMLGGQHVDAQGRPFVVVYDSLRAEHYESTRGSFKFTHETWSELSRRQEAYPDDIRMVGWYHTHPDWGVFLSGMDLFICEHFFNRPLDLALVIDPCRQDRGWFCWTGTQGQPPRRTGGFQLFSSRHRLEELQHFAQLWEGSSTMPATMRSGAPAHGGFGAPVVNVVPERNPWLPASLLGLFVMQGVLLLAVVWLAMESSRSGAIVQQLELDREKGLLEARRETLDQIAGLMADTKSGFVHELEKRTDDSKLLRTQLDAVTRDSRDGHALIKVQKEEIAYLTRDREKLREKLIALEDSVKRLEREGQLATTENGAPAATTKTYFSRESILIGVGMMLFVLVGGIGWLVLQRRANATQDSSSFDEPGFVPVSPSEERPSRDEIGTRDDRSSPDGNVPPRNERRE